jgi:hypothetical protein
MRQYIPFDTADVTGARRKSSVYYILQSVLDITLSFNQSTNGWALTQLGPF